MRSRSLGEQVSRVRCEWTACGVSRPTKPPVVSPGPPPRLHGDAALCSVVVHTKRRGCAPQRFLQNERRQRSGPAASTASARVARTFMKVCDAMLSVLSSQKHLHPILQETARESASIKATPRARTRRTHRTPSPLCSPMITCTMNLYRGISSSAWPASGPERKDLELHSLRAHPEGGA